MSEKRKKRKKQTQTPDTSEPNSEPNRETKSDSSPERPAPSRITPEDLPEEAATQDAAGKKGLSWRPGQDANIDVHWQVEEAGGVPHFSVEVFHRQRKAEFLLTVPHGGRQHFESLDDCHFIPQRIARGLLTPENTELELSLYRGDDPVPVIKGSLSAGYSPKAVSGKSAAEGEAGKGKTRSKGRTKSKNGESEKERRTDAALWVRNLIYDQGTIPSERLYPPCQDA